MGLTVWDGLAATLLVLYLHDFHGQNSTETKELARKDELGKNVYAPIRSDVLRQP